MEKTGFLRSNYAPPLLRGLWRLGLEVPPPHFASFFPVAAVTAVFFGVPWGAFMWFLVWSPQAMSGVLAIVGASLAGISFGIAMAAYYAHGRRKHKLPDWSSLDGKTLPSS